MEEVEDIFAKQAVAPKLEEKNISIPVEPIVPKVPSQFNQEIAVSKKSPVLTILLIVVGSIAVLLLIASVWIFWQKKNDVKTTNINSSVLQDQGVLNINLTPDNTNSSNTNINTVVPYQDSDHDGLSNEAEAKYLTNPDKADSDEDGLTDREEVRVYLTDPNNKDTDGDGFLDGAEVDDGYNPNGSGYLIDYQKELNKKLNINK